MHLQKFCLTFGVHITPAWRFCYTSNSAIPALLFFHYSIRLQLHLKATSALFFATFQITRTAFAVGKEARIAAFLAASIERWIHSPLFDSETSQRGDAFFAQLLILDCENQERRIILLQLCARYLRS